MGGERFDVRTRNGRSWGSVISADTNGYFWVSGNTSVGDTSLVYNHRNNKPTRHFDPTETERGTFQLVERQLDKADVSSSIPTHVQHGVAWDLI